LRVTRQEGCSNAKNEEEDSPQKHSSQVRQAPGSKEKDGREKGRTETSPVEHGRTGKLKSSPAAAVGRWARHHGGTSAAEEGLHCSVA
jgi:hypothetical protein